MRQLTGHPVMVAILVGLVVVNGCSSSSAGPVTEVTDLTTQASTALSTTPATAPGPDYAQLDQLWLDLWATVPAADPAAVRVKVNGFAATDSLTGLREYAFSKTPPADQPIDHYPVRTLTSADTATIDDCLVFTGSDQLQALHFTGKATWANKTWTLQSVTAAGGGLTQSYCIPKPINDTILAAYQKLSAGISSLTEHPKPDDPALDEYTTGTYRSFLQKVLTDLQANSHYVVRYSSKVELNPEVTAYTTGRAYVTDCVDTFPELGEHRADGARVGKEIPAGKQSINEMDLTLEGNQWKASDVRGSHGATCTKRPSSAAIAIVD
jgi:hypothetical protein